MKKRKKLKKSQKAILIVGVLLLFLVIAFFVIKDNRKLTFIEKTIKDSTLFVNKTIMYPFNLVKSYNIKKIKELEKTINSQNQSKINNLKKENEELKKSLELNNLLSDYDIINATVINRNIGYWYNTVVIDKGSKSGIDVNMAVTTPSGLIGKVIKTTKYNSTIKLLTSDDVNNKVSVQIKVKDQYVYGILTSFDQKNKQYIVEGITNTKEIKVDSSVSTTGMGDIFPSGLLIGKVVKIEKDNFDLEAIIKVEPTIDINNFNYVSILRRNQ